MRTVRIGELRNHLSRYLRVVRDGASLIVMDRETPVAEIRPIASEPIDESNLRDDLVRRGVLVPAPRGSLTLDELGPPVRCRTSVLDALREDRDAD